MQAIIAWHGQEVRVIVVHIRAPSFGSKFGKQLLVVKSFDASEQVLSYDRLIPLIEASEEPVVLLGDFNTTERQAGYQRLYEIGLKDAHEEVGWGLGLTYPAPFHRFSWLPFSLIRIDHVFYDESWRAAKTWTMSLMRSDHQAVVADLQWVGDE
jgi:endonuclease/exonuclease/phosphatase (EEP) superfamily protein YafD